MRTFDFAQAEGKFVKRDDDTLNSLKAKQQIEFRYANQEGKES